MNTEQIAEKAKEYSNKINRLSPEHSDNTICPITPKELKRYTINDFISGAEWMNQQWQEKVRWIPVEEKLPEKDKTVLCKIKLFNSMNIYYGICLFLSKNEWINMGNTSYSNFETSVSKVTHWREIIE